MIQPTKQDITYVYASEVRSALFTHGLSSNFSSADEVLSRLHAYGIESGSLKSASCVEEKLERFPPSVVQHKRTGNIFAYRQRKSEHLESILAGADNLLIYSANADLPVGEVLGERAPYTRWQVISMLKENQLSVAQIDAQLKNEGLLTGNSTALYRHILPLSEMGLLSLTCYSKYAGAKPVRRLNSELTKEDIEYIAQTVGVGYRLAATDFLKKMGEGYRLPQDIGMKIRNRFGKKLTKNSASIIATALFNLGKVEFAEGIPRDNYSRVKLTKAGHSFAETYDEALNLRSSARFINPQIVNAALDKNTLGKAHSKIIRESLAKDHDARGRQKTVRRYSVAS